MDIFTYTAYKNSDDAIALAREHSKMRVRDENELASLLRAVYKNLRVEEKEPFLLRMAEIHPDRELLAGTKETVVSDMADNVPGDCHCGHCMARRQIMTSEVIGTHVGANGMNAVGHYMNTGIVPPNMQSGTPSENNEVNNLKNENMMRSMLNDRVFKILVMGAIAFMLYKIVKK